VPSAGISPDKESLRYLPSSLSTMSLVCHTIVSSHDPVDNEPIDQEVDIDQEQWRIGAALAPAKRLHLRPVPNFVPARLETDEYGMPKRNPIRPSSIPSNNNSQEVSSWYRSLTSRAKGKQRTISPAPLAGSAPSSSHKPESSMEAANSFTPRSDWFSSQPVKHHEEPPASTSTLSDLLSRNPPPLPSEPAFIPPVFLYIGPSNKGFNMLQRKGWREGEGLGSGRIELTPRWGIGMNKALESSFIADQKKNLHFPGAAVKEEIIDLTLSDSEQVPPTPEVLDLTISDDESEASDTETEEEQYEEVEDGNVHPSVRQQSSSHGTTLITPIATTLKADRLGIGLKTKRRGAAKAKAITHTSAAIAAHIRTSNQTRKEFKARYGRGSRGFARAKRKEETDRVNMLAYLNS